MRFAFPLAAACLLSACDSTSDFDCRTAAHECASGYVCADDGSECRLPGFGPRVDAGRGSDDASFRRSDAALPVDAAGEADPCSAAECGRVQGTECGTCASATAVCEANRCVEVEDPCEGKACGTAGGMDCGTCQGATAVCQDNQCVDWLAACAGAGMGGIEWVASGDAGLCFTRSEVTVDQYRRCADAGACPAAPADCCPDQNIIGFFCPTNTGLTGRGDHPVNCVLPAEAGAFCAWAGGRLPTSEEWEAEARRGRPQAYPWGDEVPDCAHAVMNAGEGAGCGTAEDGVDTAATLPVCTHRAGDSANGLCDMAGNAAEFTSTVGTSQETGDIGHQFVRGGAYYSRSDSVELTNDHHDIIDPNRRALHTGLRCALPRPE